MALKTQTLFGTRDLVELAIERLREFEPKEGYYLAFSGGKDSCTIKALADMAGVKYDAHYNYVGIDPPELVQFIKKHHPDVAWNWPKERFFKAMMRKGFPPMRHIRWCCELLKHGAGEGGRVVVTGVRWAESHRRAQRRYFEGCKKDPSKHYLHPIIDWKDEDVWAFLKAEGIPYCHLYDEGHTRLGCLMCPMASTKKRKMEAERYPKFANAFLVAFRRLWKLAEAKGKPFTRWKDPEENFHWWLHHDGWNEKLGKNHPDQKFFCFDD
jgi:phosphoadenosine phosphosulfate reductase